MNYDQALADLPPVPIASHDLVSSRTWPVLTSFLLIRRSSCEFELVLTIGPSLQRKHGAAEEVQRQELALHADESDANIELRHPIL